MKNIGERPCEKGVDLSAKETLSRILKDIAEESSGREIQYIPASTDCNIPLSLGIPSVCISVYDGGGAHTREEWIDKNSLKTGLMIALKAAVKFT